MTEVVVKEQCAKIKQVGSCFLYGEQQELHSNYVCQLRAIV